MTDSALLNIRRYSALAAILLLFSAGCGSGQQMKLSSPHIQAINYNQRGLRAEARGDHNRAREEFASSLRLHGTIDNTEGKTVALINIARVCRIQGELDQARSFIDQAVKLAPAGSPLFTEVAYEKALISLLEGDGSVAKKWVKEAGLDDSLGSAARHNLLARILMHGKNRTESGQYAEKALSLARKHELREEEANALRLLGEIARLQERHPESRNSYEQALAIDKGLGKSRKIALDLRGLARLSIAVNDYSGGINYYRRAFAVSSAAGDNSAAAGDLMDISKLLESSGDKRQAAEVMAEHDEFLRKIDKSK